MENTFASLPISEAIIKVTEELGFTQMTEIQQKAIPVMLAGKDLIAKAPTGTGKTCAFGIPVIEHIDPDLPQIQAIVLAPTRELATQICDDNGRCLRRSVDGTPEAAASQESTDSDCHPGTSA